MTRISFIAGAVAIVLRVFAIVARAFSLAAWPIALALCAIAVLALMNRDERLGEGSEVASKTSPDGLSRAFVWVPGMGDAALGATVSQPYQVWLETSFYGEKQRNLIVSGDKTDGFQLAWTGAGDLSVCYTDAHIYRFRNFIYEYTENQRLFDVSTNGHLYKVEVVLRKAANCE